MYFINSSSLGSVHLSCKCEIHHVHKRWIPDSSHDYIEISKHIEHLESKEFH